MKKINLLALSICIASASAAYSSPSIPEASFSETGASGRLTAQSFDLPSDLSEEDEEIKKNEPSENESSITEIRSEDQEKASSREEASGIDTGRQPENMQQKSVIYEESGEDQYTELPADEDEDYEYSADIGLIIKDKKGRLQKDAPQISAGQEFTVISGADAVFSSKYSSRLNAQDKEALLSSLGIFYQSKYAKKVFPESKIVIAEPDGKNIRACVYDLDLTEYYELKVPVNTADLYKNICEMAYKNIGHKLTPVIVNTDSSKYHLPGASHISKNARTYAFKDKELAKRQSYTPCPVCFPEENAYLNQSRYERSESSEAENAITQRYRVSQDAKAIEKVNEIGRKLLVSNSFSPDYCRFTVLDSDEAQALSLPSGAIFITSGLLNLIESDDEIAAVLGHEFAHITLQHGKNSSNRSFLGGILNTALRYTGNYWAYLGGRQAVNLINKGFSRDQEYDADAKAVYYTFSAGYNPSEFCSTLEKLDLYQSHSGNKPLVAWLSDHPSSPNRIENVKKECSKLKVLTDASEYAEKIGDAQFSAALHRCAPAYQKNSESIKNMIKAYEKLNF